MGDDVSDEVGVTHYGEVEPPVLVDAGLPAISGFIVLLGVQRGMPEILLKRLTCLNNAFRTWGGASRKAAWARGR
jgi:hypothetical protein